MEWGIVDSIPPVEEVVYRLSRDPRVGSVQVFVGVVRGREVVGGLERRVLRLEYDVNEELAERVLKKLVEETVGKHGVFDAAVYHIRGRAPPGIPVLLVAVASAHREEGFRALAELVDRVKREAPIWKKEVWEGGEEWK